MEKVQRQEKYLTKQGKNPKAVGQIPWKHCIVFSSWGKKSNAPY